jgi:hypothetical protein
METRKLTATIVRTIKNTRSRMAVNRKLVRGDFQGAITESAAHAPPISIPLVAKKGIATTTNPGARKATQNSTAPINPTTAPKAHGRGD